MKKVQGQSFGMLGKKHSKKTKQKMSNSRKKFLKTPEGKKFKKKLSIFHKGKSREPFSDEWKRNISEGRKGKFKGKNNPFYGKHHSTKTKKEISKSLVGRFKGENNPNFEKHLSEEHKRKISESEKGKIVSEKVKRKISKTGKERMKELMKDPEFYNKVLQSSYGKKCYYDNEFFPSLLERDCYIFLKSLNVNIIHNFLNRFDFLINDKIVLEFHPCNTFLEKRSYKKYYNDRRKLLNEMGYTNLNLIVVTNLNVKEKIKLEKVFEKCVL